MTQIAEKLVAELERQGKHITFAESCTGGLTAATLVGVSGSSRVFDGSFVTYANAVKIKLLGVSSDSIAAHGVVSEEVAGQMATGAANAFAADIGIGISGIAGPDGGTPTKPVGTVCFGFCVAGHVTTETMHFTGDRMAVRQAAAEHALTRAYELMG